MFDMMFVFEIEGFFKEYSNTISFIGLVISALTLFLAYKIKRQFSNNHIKIKQIDHVCDLIQYLNNSKIEIQFSTYNGNGSYSSFGYCIKYNIFEIAEIDQLDLPLDDEYDDNPVFFSKNCNQLFIINQFIDHPLTPRSIADELLNLHGSHSYSIEAGINDTIKDFVLLDTKYFDENITNLQSKEKVFLWENDLIAFKTWLNLKLYANNLTVIINKWLSENGIPENNIRKDFK